MAKNSWQLGCKSPKNAGLRGKTSFLGDEGRLTGGCKKAIMVIAAGARKTGLFCGKWTFRHFVYL
ncbi:hypothetical protein D5272_11290 [bacterium D16-76]|nr:hypothetical protein [bacterium D16-76]